MTNKPSNMNSRSDRSDAKPIVTPSPIQGLDRPTETSITTAVDSLDNAYDITPAWDEIGRKSGTSA